jgi:formate--tetrahydrofolate ligase
MRSDIEIAQSTPLRPIADIARERLGLPDEALVPYGRHKAKVTLAHLRSLEERPNGRLVLVTGINPTPAGEGKTTTTVGLGDALNRIGERAVVCLREPSLGPVFGMKGGAAGGGHAQVVPMEDINLHFTGDFQAIALAHNLLSALIDNHIHHGNALRIDARRIAWKRVVDMNDRALREIVVGMGGPGNGFTRQDGFDIVVASEIMAILCLATSLADLKARIARIVVATSLDGKPVTAADLQATGAMTALLRDAIQPNLVQTLEHNPAFIHGGPFANIAHGCNSVLATRTALKLADYVVTEAGFGADLGAEKFIDIKCRQAGLKPAAAVVVATVRALKYHGGVAVADLARPDVAALERGMANLERHLHNVREVYGLPCVVALNHRTEDSEAEVRCLVDRVQALGSRAIVARHWAEGGAGAAELAREVVRLCESAPGQAGGAGDANGGGTRFVYDDELPLWDKMRTVATRVYGAADITADAKVRSQIQALQDAGHGRLPVCVAKTQVSFSTDPSARGAPSGHMVQVREVRLAAGAGFVVMICGDILTMPGLPKTPSACAIDVDDHGRISGLF